MWFNKKEENRTDIHQSNGKYFDENWLELWRQSLSKSEKFQKAAKNWKNKALLKFKPIPEHLD